MVTRDYLVQQLSEIANDKQVTVIPSVCGSRNGQLSTGTINVLWEVVRTTEKKDQAWAIGDTKVSSVKTSHVVKAMESMAAIAHELGST